MRAGSYRGSVYLVLTVQYRTYHTGGDLSPPDGTVPGFAGEGNHKLFGQVHN